MPGSVKEVKKDMVLKGVLTYCMLYSICRFTGFNLSFLFAITLVFSSIR